MARNTGCLIFLSLVLLIAGVGQMALGMRDIMEGGEGTEWRREYHYPNGRFFGGRYAHDVEYTYDRTVRGWIWTVCGFITTVCGIVCAISGCCGGESRKSSSKSGTSKKSIVVPRRSTVSIVATRGPRGSSRVSSRPSHVYQAVPTQQRGNQVVIV